MCLEMLPNGVSIEGSAMDALRVAYIRLGLAPDEVQPAIAAFLAAPPHINRDDVRREFAVLNEPHHEPEYALEVLHPEEEDLGSIEDDAPLEEPVHGELPLDFPGQHDQQTTSDQLILQSEHAIIDDVEDQGIPRQDVQMRPPVVISDDAQESRTSREEVQRYHLPLLSQTTMPPKKTKRSAPNETKITRIHTNVLYAGFTTRMVVWMLKFSGTIPLNQPEILKTRTGWKRSGN
ncbi:hypothetical protein PF005_g8341 [Phytophthora fragariae]|nr:hypothetical protein PF005_g8341 [Phytophthora fragariae]KAE9315831.1 hypothetical protein PF001_g7603 [Phytophthora fragariae]